MKNLSIDKNKMSFIEKFSKGNKLHDLFKKIILALVIIIAFWTTIDFLRVLKTSIQRGLIDFRIISKTGIYKDPNLIWTVISNPSNDIDYLKSISLDKSGIYIVGTDFQPGNSQWRIEKRNLENGSLIWTITQNYSNFSDSANDIAIDDTGIYIIGTSGEKGEWRIEKRDKENGNLIWNVTSTLGVARAVAIDKAGVYIGGIDTTSEKNSWRIEKRNKTNGELIWVVATNFNGGLDEIRDITLDDTSIYIAGIDSIKNSSFQVWRIEKRSSRNGSLIWSTTSTPGVFNDVYSVAIDDTGIYIAGEKWIKTQDTFLGTISWKIEKRNLVDGSLIWEIDSKTENPKENLKGPILLAIDETGLYVTGPYFTQGLDTEWRIEKRNPKDGKLISVYTLNFSKNYDSPSSIAIDKSGIYIGGIDNQPDDRFPGRLFFNKIDYEWRIAKIKK
jgi:hypothetical protein